VADISIPGISSRFETDKMIDGLMKVERIPRDRVEQNVGALKTQKESWQALGRRITSLREGANQLYSYQNPFSERNAISSSPAVIEASAGREARDQSHDFLVKQLAQADKFISKSLDQNFRVGAGNYRFSTGESEVSFKFDGGNLQEFSDALNRRAGGKIASNIIAVKSGTRSFVIESLVTGAENRLQFKNAALQFAVDTGIVARVTGEPKVINIPALPVNKAGGEQNPRDVLNDNSLKVAALSEATVDMNGGITPTATMFLKFDSALPAKAGEWVSEEIAGASGAADAADETPGAEYLNVLSLKFSDDSEAELSPISDSETFTTNTYNLFEISGGKTISSLEIRNNNTRHDISIRNIQVMDTSPQISSEPIKAISTARDAILVMDGIEIERPTNTIDDLIPGLNLKLKSASDTQVNITVESNSGAVKDSVITLVGSYNRLMAELNVLTRSDESVLNELTYLNDSEREELRGKLGQFAGDSTLLKLRNDLINTVSASYQTSADGAALLANFGIATDVRRAGAGGYDPSRMRGYLEIDETSLDAALATNAATLKEIMGRDSDGDLIVDSGLAYRLERVARPFVEIGGIIASKTGTLDTRISADNRRIESLDQQLDRKERELRIQYGRMEDAYSRMDQMSRSLDNFSSQSGGNRR
jgi:flagellar hook-associated protein 2